MKKYYHSFLPLILLISICFLQQGCIKDKCTHKYSVYVYKPVYKPMQDLRQVTIQPPKEITANGKICIKNNFIYLNEVNKGFHVIDNNNPSAPKKVAFVSVPGCMDMAVKGNFLLVDNYLDLLTFDISNPANIAFVNRKENALPYRQYNYGFYDDSVKGVIVKFDKTELKEAADCQENRNWWINSGMFFTMSSSTVPGLTKASGANGQAGSLSRFALLNNYLYVAGRYSLSSIDVSNPLQPDVKPAVSALGEVETIYPFNNVLLLGSPTGMRIFSVTNPAQPAYTAGVSHWRGCDPVVAENNVAYVTVRSNGPCGGNLSELDVIDISNITKPVLIKTYPMQNPYGLGICNNTLGICDGDAGFKLYNASQTTNLQLLSGFNSIKAFDVIMSDTIALLVAKDGMYQYDISNKSLPVLLSKLPVVLQ